MKKISIFLLGIISLVTVSCDKGFEELNQDPNRPVDVPGHLLLGNIIRINQNAIYNAQAGGDMGICWSQQWSKVQYNDEERYIPRRTVIDGVWSAMYTQVLNESLEIERLADLEGNSNLKGMAIVMRANAFQILTDLYGPIPFTEALNKDISQPKYDSQEVVYDGIVAMLDQADAILASGSGSVPASSDLIYGGDASKWRKLANALKLKALMRISKASGVNNAAEIQAVVTAGNLMQSNDDSAKLIYLSANPDANPIYETIVFGTRAEYKVSSVLVSKMNGTSDPRLPVYAQVNNAGNYVGNVPGTENPGSYPAFSSPGTLILSPTFPGYIMTYAQQELLIAEAINEGYVAGTLVDVKSHFDAGVIASCTQFGLTTGTATTFATQPAFAFATAGDAKTAIGEQLWLSLYGQGFEAWTEWRRTGLPALSPVVNAAPGVPTIPSRLFYPTNEVSLNNANYSAASATLNNGDKLTSKLWFQP